LSEHPGGELANLTFDTRDPTEEFNMIHPDIIGMYAPDALIGKSDSGVGVAAGTAPKVGGSDPTSKDKGSMLRNHQAWEKLDVDSHLNLQVNANDNLCCGTVSGRAVAALGGGGFHMEEVAKHSSKKDYWAVMAGEVLDFTGFLSEHSGGELAKLTSDGKDAAEEFNMVHTDIFDTYAPDAVTGEAGSGVGVGAVTASQAGGGDPISQDKGSTPRNYQAWEKWNVDLHFSPQVNVKDNLVYGSSAGHQVFYLMNEGIPEVLITMRVATKETDNCKLSSDSFSD
jgi:cytochrome b involved in lipid metabolism